MYKRYTIDNDLVDYRKSTKSVESMVPSQSIDWLTPGTTTSTIPLCTGLFPQAGKLQMKSRSPKFPSNNSSVDCSLQKTAAGNGNLQPEVEINEYSSTRGNPSWNTRPSRD